MPWKETTPVAERMPFLVDYRSGLFTSFTCSRGGTKRRAGRLEARWRARPSEATTEFRSLRRDLGGSRACRYGGSSSGSGPS